VRPLGGRSLREQIAAEAAPEQRNEHGMPIAAVSGLHDALSQDVFAMTTALALEGCPMASR